MDGLLAGHAQAILEDLPFAHGAHVVDVGCGCGALSLDLAREGAKVTGVDVSKPMLEHARRRATDEGLDVDFVLADAQIHDLPKGSVNHVVSRFGLMFFTDPAAAFANIRGWLAPGGSLSFVCWQPVADNPWWVEPAKVTAPFLDDPGPSDPNAPGPFSLSDPVTVYMLLSNAGFGSVDLQPLELPMRVVGPPEAGLRFLTERGHAEKALQIPEAVAPVTEGLRALVTANHDGEAFSMASSSWLVRAR
jgi:SAM-dependent methyltransferase